MPPNIPPPPGMPMGPLMGPEAWGEQYFRPNPDRPEPLDRNFGGIQAEEMGMRLRQALARGDITKTQIDRWVQEPWKAYPFLNNTLRTNDPMMASLGRWYLASNVGRSPEERRMLAEQWERTNPQSQDLRMLVNSLHAGLTQTVNTRIATNTHLRQLREAQHTNALEGFGSKFMDYMRDWREHPLTAAGVVVGFYMLFKAVKNKNIGAVLGLGAVGVALYSFLRDQYGIEPIESLVAKPLDTWGMNTAARWLRKTRDTLKRPFVPSEEEGSAFTYLGDKLSINGDDEKRMLGAIWDMRPGDFLAAHQQVLNAEMGPVNQAVRLPPAVRQILRQMGADQTMSRKWGNYTDRQRAQIFLRVSNKILQSMPGGMRFGTKYISDRFVTGAFFAQAGSRRGGRMAGVNMAYPMEDRIMSDMQYAVQRADMRMGDVLISTVMDAQDWENIKGYKGGLGAVQIIDGLQRGTRAVWDVGADAVGGTYNLLRNELPNTWNYNLLPFLQSVGLTPENFQGWMYQSRDALQAAQNSVIGFKDYVAGTALWRVTRDGTIYVFNEAKRGWEVIGNILEDFAKWMDLQRAMQEGRVGPGGSVVPADADPKFREWSSGDPTQNAFSQQPNPQIPQSKDGGNAFENQGGQIFSPGDPNKNAFKKRPSGNIWDWMSPGDPSGNAFEPK